MPPVTMRQLLDEAAKGGCGVGAFNVNSFGQVRAIIMEDAAEVYPEILLVREIREGIEHEVRNANVDTALRLAATGAIRKAFTEDPGEFDPRYYLVSARAAMRRVVRARMEAFGQEAGHAEDYAPVSPADMAVRHKERGHQPSAT